MPDLFSGFETVASVRQNQLFYGDNLTIMRNMPSACVDLIYLDPPFNSQRTYNLIYHQLTGLPVPEQEEAFCDAWELDPEKDQMVRDFPQVLREHDIPDDVVQFWTIWLNALKHTQPRLLAYLVYMSYRLLEMRRILKPTGSLYLHCDPTASHYIKVIMDGVFGHQNFRNEVIWKRTGSHGGANRWGPVHDNLLFYTKSDSYTWNAVFQEYDETYLDKFYRFKDARGRYRLVTLTGAGTRTGDSGKPWRNVDPTIVGRHWAVPLKSLRSAYPDRDDIDRLSTQQKLDLLDAVGLIYWPPRGSVPQQKRYSDENPGVRIQDIVADIGPVSSQADERLGYPTQKPIALLRRIVAASSNPGDAIFDPFCGCGTAIYAAHELGRRWVGCDIAILSVKIVRDVLLKRYGLEEGQQYEVDGVPVSEEQAEELFKRDPRQFQNWAVELSGGFCNKKQSGDRGIDGRIYFESGGNLRSMVISVKGGEHVSPAFVRELRGTLERESGADLAGFISLTKPTRGMLRDVADAGMFTYRGHQYPRLQIRTIADLLAGKTFDTPSRVEAMNWERQTILPLTATP
jgi:DNA modification methylase